MANTTRGQFDHLIEVYEANKGLSNEDMVEVMHKAEPRIKVQTITVYRSTIENYIASGLTGSAVGEKFVKALESYYGTDDDEVKNDSMMTIIRDRDMWKAECARLQAQLDIIYNTF